MMKAVLAPRGESCPYHKTQGVVSSRVLVVDSAMFWRVLFPPDVLLVASSQFDGVDPAILLAVSLPRSEGLLP